jgi:DNA polymerase-3 subunit epsilon
VEYEQIVQDVRAAMTGDCRTLVTDLRARIATLSTSQRFEQAALVRDRMVAVVRAAARVQRIGGLASCPEIVAARRPPQGGWEIVLVRHGRLAGTTVSPRGSDPWPYVHALRATGEVVEPPVLPAPACSPEEAEKLLRWLEADGTRLVDVQGAWSCPLHGAGFERARLDPLSAALSAGVVGFEDRLTGVAG